MKQPRPCTGRCAARASRAGGSVLHAGRAHRVQRGEHHPGLHRAQPLSRHDARRGSGNSARWWSGCWNRRWRTYDADSDPGAGAGGHAGAGEPLHPLQARPAPEALVPAMPDAPGVLLARQAAVMLAALLDGIRAAGRIVPVSGWRSHAEQQALYADSVRDNGLEFTQKYVALPGCSEHETGLAIDVGEAREVIDFIRPAFPDTGVCGGFPPRGALRLHRTVSQRRAQAVTGIGHEPWHFSLCWLAPRRADGTARRDAGRIHRSLGGIHARTAAARGGRGTRL